MRWPDLWVQRPPFSMLGLFVVVCFCSSFWIHILTACNSRRLELMFTNDWARAWRHEWSVVNNRVAWRSLGTHDGRLCSFFSLSLSMGKVVYLNVLVVSNIHLATVGAVPSRLWNDGGAGAGGYHRTIDVSRSCRREGEKECRMQCDCLQCQ